MKGPPTRPNSPAISINMTDLDVIQKYASYMNGTVQSWKNPSAAASHHKRSYLCIIRGAKAREWMARLLPLMGKRRQSQIKKALASYDPQAKNKAAFARRKISDQDMLDIKRMMQTASLRSIAAVYDVHHETLRYRLGRSKASPHS